MRKRISLLVLTLEITCIIVLHVFKLTAHSEKANNNISAHFSNPVHLSKSYTVSSLK